MKNSGIRRKPDMPKGHSRRHFLALLGMLPFAGLFRIRDVDAAPIVDGIIVRDGWILRADDLRRLGIS
jgi:hypothetical protein